MVDLPAQGNGKGEARDWKLLQKPLSLLRAAASMLEHMPPGTWMRLVALHIHCLRQLSLHLVVRNDCSSMHHLCLP